MYNAQRNESGNFLPLMMGFIMPSPIEKNEIGNETMYDPISQTTDMDMRIVGTYSLKSKATITPQHQAKSDQSNAIDDQKQVS